MSIPRRIASAALAAVLLAGLAMAAAPAAEPPALTLRFAGQDYSLRWSAGHQHEFTPAGQEDLESWTDMVTVNLYPDVREGEGLAVAANSVLGNYTANGAMLLRTDSRPAAPGRPAEHLIAVAFPQPSFIEAAFARFVILDGVGASVVYSHRIYGKAAGEPMSAWLQANGTAIEEKLMALDRIPGPRELEPAPAARP